jgi:hypothetical protein
MSPGSELRVEVCSHVKRLTNLNQSFERHIPKSRDSAFLCFQRTEKFGY